ncbi:MAG: response regulator [Elusimicrobia bacterium]|nr:response regulator [Elusimicrobiota bacterium]
MAGILMVESEPLIRQVCRRIFDRDGHDVDFAATIEEAQSLVKSGSKYSLLVTDLRFPDGNGLDFARVFREYHPAGNIIVMTGLSTFQGQEKAVDLGVADYIGKPFDVHEFGIRIRELTADRSRESRPAPGRVMIAAPDGEEYIRLFIKCLDRSGFESRLIGRVEELEGDCGPALPCPAFF